MTSIDRQQAFTGTKEVAAALRLDAAKLEQLSCRANQRLRRSAERQTIQGRTIEPDLSAGDANAALCAAPQAAGKIIAVGACGRSRIPRDPRAARTRLPGRRTVCSLRGRKYRRHGVLRDGFRGRPRVLGTADAGLKSCRARGGLRRHERDHRAAARVRAGANRPVRFRPRRKLCHAPGRALVEAISVFRDRKDRRHGAADRMAAAQHSAERAGAAGAWRLPARQS